MSCHLPASKFRRIRAAVHDPGAELDPGAEPDPGAELDPDEVTEPQRQQSPDRFSCSGFVVPSRQSDRRGGWPGKSWQLCACVTALVAACCDSCCDYILTMLKAASSATSTTLGCSCKTEAGTSGVTGPQNDL